MIVYAGYSVLVASWFVLPLGAILGIVMPRVASGCSRRTAVFRGSLVGISAAVIAALITSVLLEWPTITGSATIVDHDAWWRAVTHRFVFDLAQFAGLCGMRWHLGLAL